MGYHIVIEATDHTYSDETLSHILKFFEFVIQHSWGVFASTDVGLHLVDVVLAFTVVILNVSTLGNTVSQETVESSSGLKQAIVLTILAEIITKGTGKFVERLIIWSKD